MLKEEWDQLYHEMDLLYQAMLSFQESQQDLLETKKNTHTVNSIRAKEQDLAQQSYIIRGQLLLLKEKLRVITAASPCEAKSGETVYKPPFYDLRVKLPSAPFWFEDLSGPPAKL
jgi:hypothetical protein